VPPSGSRLPGVTVAGVDDATVDDDLGEAYDLVEELCTEGQPPSPDWSKVNTLAARLAELAAKLNARFGSQG
jgi:hypothetical protein